MDHAGCCDNFIGRIRMKIQLRTDESDFESDGNNRDLSQKISEFQTVEIHLETPELSQFGQLPEDNG